MKDTRILWDMPITVDIADVSPCDATNIIFSYFSHIDDVFNTFHPTSEMSRINKHNIPRSLWSKEVQEVIELCKKTKKETNGYFQYENRDTIDPLGIVKGWAVKRAADMLLSRGYRNFYIEAGGDMQIQGRNHEGNYWKVGIRNPFNTKEVVKVLHLTDCGVATSGTYFRGDHILYPHTLRKNVEKVASLTVIAENVLEADRFATAAFAMGTDGISFLAHRRLEAYQVDMHGIATVTQGIGNA